MGIKLSSLKSERKTLAVSIGEEKLNVVYNPKAYTPEVEDAVADGFAQTGRQSRGIQSFITGLVLEWDLIDDDGTPIAPTADNLKHIPIEIQGEVLSAIVDDMSPGKDSSETSDAGSLGTPLS